MENLKYMHKEGLTVGYRDNQLATIDSREVAEMMGKEHKALLKDINGGGNTIGLIPTLIGANFEPNKYFIESSYIDSRNREQKCYLVTKIGCELLGNKQQGEKGILFTAKYVERFNEMEQAIKNPYSHLSKEVQAIFALDHKQQQLEVEVKELKDGMPLFNVECKEIQAAVKRKGVEILGGKGSAAYKNNSIRCKVYSDIQQQLRREFGVSRYEAIKRSQLNMAHEIVTKYKAPIYLTDEIYLLNQQLTDKDYAV